MKTSEQNDLSNLLDSKCNDLRKIVTKCNYYKVETIEIYNNRNKLISTHSEHKAYKVLNSTQYFRNQKFYAERRYKKQIESVTK